MNFLFWNIRGRDIKEDGVPLLRALSNIIKEESIDVLALAEYDEYTKMLEEVLLDSKLLSPVNSPINIREAVQLYYNPVTVEVKIAQNNTYSTPIKIINRFNGTFINGFFCHFPSKLRRTPSDQRDHANNYIEEVEYYEKIIGSDKTFICGDFNMSPYEEGMVNSKCFHSIMDAGVVRRYPTRNVDKKSYATFYNPMWGLFGDLGKCDVAGTYYYNQYGTNEYFWYIFDQVIIRPSLLDDFDNTKLRILTKGKTYDLLVNNGSIDLKYSDHLPISFTINL